MNTNGLAGVLGGMLALAIAAPVAAEGIEGTWHYNETMATFSGGHFTASRYCLGDNSYHLTEAGRYFQRSRMVLVRPTQDNDGSHGFTSLPGETGAIIVLKSTPRRALLLAEGSGLVSASSSAPAMPSAINGLFDDFSAPSLDTIKWKDELDAALEIVNGELELRPNGNHWSSMAARAGGTSTISADVALETAQGSSSAQIGTYFFYDRATGGAYEITIGINSTISATPSNIDERDRVSIHASLWSEKDDQSVWAFGTSQPYKGSGQFYKLKIHLDKAARKILLYVDDQLFTEYVMSSNQEFYTASDSPEFFIATYADVTSDPSKPPFAIYRVDNFRVE